MGSINSIKDALRTSKQLEKGGFEDKGNVEIELHNKVTPFSEKDQTNEEMKESLNIIDKDKENKDASIQTRTLADELFNKEKKE
jgi:hypothetical protein